MLLHLNGDLIPRADARISVFDRGFLFGDGIYEGLRAFNGWIRNLDDHIARMQNGLDEARIPWDARNLRPLSDALLDANNLTDAFLYWQITRGTPGLDHPIRARIAPPDTPPTVLGYCLPLPGAESLTEPTVCRAHTVPDQRWDRGHVKSTSLMANVIAAMDAAGRHEQAPPAEALLLRDGHLSESCATNVFVLPRDSRTLATPPVGPVSILDGVTRRIILGLRPETQVRMIAEEELRNAAEIFLVGTMTTLRCVTHLDAHPIGLAQPGPVAIETLSLYRDYVQSESAAAHGAGPTP